MRTRHIRKILSSALGLIVLGSMWFYLAPAPLGGSATYVVTHGISMEPRFHTGDLAIVRSQSSYHVGEIVAYENKMLHTIVLHRIIGRKGNRYLFKGDNNNFVDFEHPLANQLLGALWIHIPGAGATLKSIRSPFLVGVLVAIGVLLFTGVAFSRNRRRRRRQMRSSLGVASGAGAGNGASSSLLPSEPLSTALAIGLVALLPFVMLAVLAFTRPSSKLHTVPVPYKQNGSFSYSADAPPGPTYANGHAVTGDPLFTRVLNRVNFQFGYQFESPSKHSLSGTASLSATISSTSGWSTTFPLGSAVHFHGAHASVGATLELSSLLALIHTVESTTRVHGSYTLTLNPHINTTGSLDQLPLATTFAPQIRFLLNELEAQPFLGAGAESSATGGAKVSPFAPTSSGSVSAKRYLPLYVSIKIARLSVATARAVALIGIGLVICALVAILALVRPRRKQGDESATISARYSEMIIPVAHVPPTPGVSVIDVADMESLVRIAAHYDRSILHETDAQAFWVTDESGHFRYTIGGVTRTPREQVAQQPPLSVHTGDVYADELALGGVISAFQTPTVPIPIPVPEPVAAPVQQETWAAYDLADAITQESRPGRRSSDMAADGSPSRAGAFARVAGLN